jgi:cytochrome b
MMKINSSGSQAAQKADEKRLYPIRVWDLPTRLFHWLLVGLVVCSFITGKIGGITMQYHEWSGFALLVLVVFRLVWGFIGGQLSRFSSFVKGPLNVIHYALSLLKKDSVQHIGHNPLGGWSILAMLTSLLIQAGTGLFANDDILTEGPLYNLVSKKTSDWLTGIHYVNQQVLLFLIATHISAILFHLIVKRENLVKPMITGTMLGHRKIDFTWGNPAAAISILAVIAAAGYLIVYWR